MAVRNANILEVAAFAGVSVATVSRTLQFPERVAQDTKERVRSAIDHLRYVPNAQARNLRRSRTGLVVALVPDISNPSITGIVHGIETTARRHGYSVLLGDTQYQAENEQRYGDMISAREADGLITLLPRIPRINAGGRLPVVVACEAADDDTVTQVVVDNAAAMRDVMAYLLGLGHRRIGYVGGPIDSPMAVERRQGFDTAMLAAGLRIEERSCVAMPFSLDAGLRGVDLILAEDSRHTAFVCASDELAIGALRALKLRGLRVPADVSVVGFDDISVARYTDPPLTTVSMPRDALGREAMEALLQILAAPDTPARRAALPAYLIVRESTGPTG